MIEAAPGATFSAFAEDFGTGLVGTITVAILGPGAAVHTPPTSAGIYESPAGSGNYGTDSLVAPEDAGTYRVYWDDQSGTDALEELVVWPPGAGAAWTPSVDDVAALLHARTQVAGGNQVGTFNEDTEPTGEQVEELIEQAVGAVASRIGSDPCNAALRADARRMAALYAAMLIEQSYWPEQTRSDTSSFRSLKALYDDGIKALVEAVRDTCGGSGGEGAVGAAVLPVDTFPEEPILGRHTQDW